MNILVLNPAPTVLGYTLFRPPLRVPVARGAVRGDPGEAALLAVRTAVSAETAGAGPDLIGCRVVQGGDLFRNAVCVRPGTMRAIEGLVSSAPLHLPPLLALLRARAAVFAGVPMVLVFETSFFADLPFRENACALNAACTEGLAARRRGFHGILHEAACAHAAARRRARGLQSACRSLSVCLEPTPEVAAAVGCRPVMTSGGSSPLEGIPGDTTCGEIDPRIVIELARANWWGHEKINQVLSRESGLLGLTGEPVTIAGIFDPATRNGARARRVLAYRLLLACGAGAAAMGGVDAIVFSGRYASSMRFLGPWLRGRLVRAMPRAGEEAVAIECMRDTVEALVAAQAVAALPAREAAFQSRLTAARVRTKSPISTSRSRAITPHFARRRKNVFPPPSSLSDS